MSQVALEAAEEEPAELLDLSVSGSVRDGRQLRDLEQGQIGQDQKCKAPFISGNGGLVTILILLIEITTLVEF